MLDKPKDRRVAALLALAGAVLPVAGFHKFYLRQPRWGVAYLLLSLTPIPRVASAIEGIWYLFQDSDRFEQTFGNSSSQASSGANLAHPAAAVEQMGAVAEALRQLEQLRQEGLVSEYEFEQKRRQLLDRMG